MINVDMTIREAIDLISSTGNTALKDRLIKAIEVAAGDANTSLTVHTIPTRDDKIRVIKALRSEINWGLKEANDWCKVITGEAVQTPVGTRKGVWGGEITHYETHFEGGKPNTLSASSAVINRLVMALREIGCKVTTG
jgi:hypothetical protein